MTELEKDLLKIYEKHTSYSYKQLEWAYNQLDKGMHLLHMAIEITSSITLSFEDSIKKLSTGLEKDKNMYYNSN